MANPQQSSSISLLLITPKQQDQLQACLDYLAQQNTKIASNSPNLHLLNQDSEGVKIEQVRQILEKASFGAYGGGSQFFVILNAQQSSLPAQNALLKILEEPTANTRFILVTAHPQQLLPTIRSRCLTVHFPQVEEGRGELNIELGSKLSQEDQKWAALAKQLLQADDFKIDSALKLAEEFKDREQALAMCEGVLQQLSWLSKDQTLSRSQRQQATLASRCFLNIYQDLQKNLNPQLALEHHLFTLATA